VSIKKHVDQKGRTRYRVYVYDSARKKSIYVNTFDRPKDAQEAEYEAKRRLKLGESLKPREQITFDDLCRKWMTGLTTVRPMTIKDYRNAIDRMKPLLGSKYVTSITRRDIDELVSTLSARYAPSTTRKTVVIMKMILRAAVDWDYLDKEPTEGARLSLPKTKRRVFEPLTREQVDRLIDCAPEYWQPFYRFLLTSGVRRAEAWGVTTADLDLERGIVNIRRQLVKKQFVDLKTDAAYRKVPLPESTIEALRHHLAVRPDNALDLVFPTPEGKAVIPPNFYARVWIPTREKAGLPAFRMHDARHHVASVYLSQGRSITYVQRLLGHANPSTLLSIYSWVTKGEEDVATTDFERWLSE
jgi:integrase